MLWTSRAVERAGFVVSSSPQDGARIEVETMGQGGYSWRVSIGKRASVCTSLGEVVRSLRSD